MRNVIKISVALISICLLLVVIFHEKPPMFYGNYAITDSAKADKISVTILLGKVDENRIKKIKVVENGELLVKNIAEPKVEMMGIEIVNPKKSLYHSSLGDNPYYQIGVDLTENYQFYDTYLKALYDVPQQKNDYVIVSYDKKP